MLINTVDDLASAERSPERQAFLQALLDDYITFDDAKYPEGYGMAVQPGDPEYVTPVLRKEWNAGAAAAWGFKSRDEISSLLAL
jgi:hypothetical protein